MPFPTVKTSPYGVKKKRWRRSAHLWPNGWWKELCECAEHSDSAKDISEECLEMIASFNSRLADIDP